jgi:drug/metabolite transporter (DMT)-like permease
MNSRVFIACAGLSLAMMLYASSFIALKLAFRYYDPMVVIFGRMVVAGVCFLALFPLYRNRIRFETKDLKLLLFMALCEPCLYFIFESLAIEHTAASQAGMITAMLPLMVAVAAQLFLKERVSAKTMTGFFVAVSGAFWLSYLSEPSHHAPNPPLGNFFEFMAMLCATGYTIALKKLSSRYSPLFLTGFQAVAGSLFYFPVIFFPSTAFPTSVEPVGVMAVIYLGSFITLGAYGLYNFGVSAIPASQASAFVNLIPVFTVIFAGLILGERFSPLQYIASATVLLGVFISQDTRAVQGLRAIRQPIPGTGS